MSSHHVGHHDAPGHVLPFAVYVRVFVTLLVLTVITVWIAGIDFGAMNIVVAMIIASIKATVVALFFMHLKYEDPMTWLYAFFPILLLATLLAGLFIDNPYRDTPTMIEVRDTLASAPTGGASISHP